MKCSPLRIILKTNNPGFIQIFTLYKMLIMHKIRGKQQKKNHIKNQLDVIRILLNDKENLAFDDLIELQSV